MTEKPISGVYAAVLTPRLADSSIDVPALTILIHFLLGKGISTFAINGATGEFCLTTPSHLDVILSTIQQASNGQAHVLCGIGAPGTALAIELADVAQRHAVHGLLLPMPCFFPYQQQDLDLFCRYVAATTTLPILLYNLPQFTSGLEKETVLTLIQQVPNIIGIKDSSGSLDILRHLTHHAPTACRMVGNDSALVPAIHEALCDGVVSGIACAIPEIILSLYAEAPHLNSPSFHQAAARVDEYIAQLNPFPTPWGLKFTLEARKIIPATFAQPVTTHRRQQAAAMAAWLNAWLPTAIPSHTPLK